MVKPSRRVHTIRPPISLVALQDGDVDPALLQPKGRRQAGDAGADDDRAPGQRPSPRCFRAAGPEGRGLAPRLGDRLERWLPRRDDALLALGEAERPRGRAVSGNDEVAPRVDVDGFVLQRQAVGRADPLGPRAAEASGEVGLALHRLGPGRGVGPGHPAGREVVGDQREQLGDADQRQEPERAPWSPSRRRGRSAPRSTTRLAAVVGEEAERGQPRTGSRPRRRPRASGYLLYASGKRAKWLPG